MKKGERGKEEVVRRKKREEKRKKEETRKKSSTYDADGLQGETRIHASPPSRGGCAWRVHTSPFLRGRGISSKGAYHSSSLSERKRPHPHFQEGSEARRPTGPLAAGLTIDHAP